MCDRKLTSLRSTRSRLQCTCAHFLCLYGSCRRLAWEKKAKQSSFPPNLFSVGAVRVSGAASSCPGSVRLVWLPVPLPLAPWLPLFSLTPQSCSYFASLLPACLPEPVCLFGTHLRRPAVVISRAAAATRSLWLNICNFVSSCPSTYFAVSRWASLYPSSAASGHLGRHFEGTFSLGFDLFWLFFRRCFVLLLLLLLPLSITELHLLFLSSTGPQLLSSPFASSSQIPPPPPTLSSCQCHNLLTFTFSFSPRLPSFLLWVSFRLF